MVTDVDRGFERRTLAFLLASGLCALVYQVAWLRLLRLIFGASTAASAATLGIFMGGLGLGSLLLGPRVDRVANPLRLYARLEIGIGLAAGLSPWAIACVAWIYRSLGGTESLGSLGGTALRLVLAAIVLGVPTFLMGGTLPAVVRTVTNRRDLGRSRLGLMYGTNTIGAVLGAALTTFVLLEQLGTTRTIWIAALVNLLVARWALSVSREIPEEPDSAVGSDVKTGELSGGSSGRRSFVVFAAFGVGAAFFLVELVWYRMLSPILGGSTYTFGVILSVALAGVGAGGWLYSLRPPGRRPTLSAFSWTCSWEAFLLLVPFALGDRLAFFAATVRSLEVLGFSGIVFSWFLVAILVVLPASVVAGYQFPLLVGILGSGREGVGREIGLAYAANTLGAIVGSVAGGFLLLPRLGAPELWVATALALLGLSAAALWMERGRVRVVGQFAWVAPLWLVILLLAGTSGPGAYWRHDGIGAGRSELVAPDGSLRAMRFEMERDIVWEEDGLESSVALRGSLGYSFSVNGKTDGHAVLDGGTQVMSPLVGALLHPNPRRGLVIGLGTGSSAGWLAAVPTMESVDVYELEESILRVARDSAPVNHQVLDDPKVTITLGDGRELLLTTSRLYDVIFSEPSNPYRAGISSLFTQEFYRAAAGRLNPEGLFCQWLQAYEVDGESVGTVVRTLRSVFASVEVWQVGRGDLLLVASNQPTVHDIDRIRARVRTEPYASALAMTWGTAGAEGLYAGFVANRELADRLVGSETIPLNTDDLPIIEYGFARNLGRKSRFSIDELKRVSARLGWDSPEVSNGSLDSLEVHEMKVARWMVLSLPGFEFDRSAMEDPAAEHRNAARRAFVDNDLAATLTEWLSQSELPESRADRLLLAASMAATGHPETLMATEWLAEVQATEAKILEGLYYREMGDEAKALEALLDATVRLRTDPWVAPALTGEHLLAIGDLGLKSANDARSIHEALAEPFAVEMHRANRLLMRYRLIAAHALGDRCLETFADFEPYPLWMKDFLTHRRSCYLAHSSPLAEQAVEDLERFLDEDGLDLRLQWFGLDAP